ncbi:hypothetical protein [Rubinisphaera margarita]|uniref:hypothetical protein n=1 Tax=Rubinisphaera margarita TaxID=2909586 RepID=UPI001EE7977D|nr:hypothetical protein [Rubinisphaera margarita]MCG6156125.1 hypothetical protein [Rubinisphaera margarita]
MDGWRSKRWVCCGILLTGFFLNHETGQSVIHAGDYFLTIGGGYAPSSNQISLERNVIFFQDVLGRLYRDPVHHDVLFSDGNDPGRDLQFRRVAPLPREYELLGQLFDAGKGQKNFYRDHELNDVRGSSSLTQFKSWIKETGATLTPDDRLVIYVTAHGGKSTTKGQSGNTCIYLWNKERLDVAEFARSLKELPAEVPVALVMVQCYSGGFTNLLFESGDRSRGIADRDVAVFCATIESRPAAGCTADINEENYHEYSSSFWAAIGGQTRTGDSVPAADFDQNGRVSLSEAHAFAVATLPSIDLPICTSDVFLRQYSSQTDAGGEEVTLVTDSAPRTELEALATPAQKYVLDSLTTQLEIADEDLKSKATELKRRLDGELKEIDRQLGRARGQVSSSRTLIQRTVLTRWPELNQSWHPEIASIVENDRDALLNVIETHSEFAQWQQRVQAVEELDAQKLQKKKEQARCERLLYLLESLALTANLPLVASEEIQQRYTQLRAMEGMSLGTGSGSSHEMTTVTARKIPPTETSPAPVDSSGE